MIARPLDQPPHALPPAAVVAHFGTDPVRGLTRSEAVRRLTIAGPNELPAAARTPAWRMLLAQCKTVRELFVAGASVGVTGVGYAPQGWLTRDGQRVEPDQVLHEVLAAAALCTDARLMQAADGRWRITGDPTEGALLTLAAKVHLTKDALEAAEPVGHCPAVRPANMVLAVVHASQAPEAASTPGGACREHIDRALRSRYDGACRR